MGERRQKQECSAVGHQRRNGARFRSYHPDLSGIIGQYGYRQGKQSDIEISIRTGLLSEWKFSLCKSVLSLCKRST